MTNDIYILPYAVAFTTPGENNLLLLPPVDSALFQFAYIFIPDIPGVFGHFLGRRVGDIVNNDDGCFGALAQGPGTAILF
jgi:hypothetical protein